MNRTLVFRNFKAYDLFLPTPSGAGRRLPANKCVSGSFYINLANTGYLVKVPEHLVVEEDILWNAELSGYQYRNTEPVAPPVVEVPVAVVDSAPEPEVAPVVETPVVVEAAPVEPPETAETRELMKLGMEELKMIAATKGIDFPIDIKKKKLIKLINSAK
jgi:hypothetical protein